MRRSELGILMLLVACACGPKSIGADESGATEATSGDPEGGSSEVDSGSENDFVPKFDEADDESCDPWAQDCPDGEKCVPFSTNGSFYDANKCVPVTGGAAPGEPCIYDGIEAATDDCDGSGMCWYVEEIDGEQQGTCVAFCQGSADVPICAEGSVCPISADGTINVCLPTCDPIAQDCPDGLGCYWASNEFICVPTSENIPVGEPCGYVNDCIAGAMCLDPSLFPECAGGACCGAFCDLGLGDAPCEALLPGTVCSAFFEEGSAPTEYQHVGVCILP